jgi:mRNA interferase MazF
MQMLGAKLSSGTLPTNLGVTADPSPRRGEVWLVSFDPSLGGEIQKTRLAVVISNDTATAVLNRIQVVPISSKVERLYPAEAYVSLNGERRKAMGDQITTTSKRRLQRRLGALGKDDLDAVIRVVRLQLAL